MSSEDTEYIVNRLGGIEASVDDLLNVANTPYLKIGWRYLPINGGIYYTVFEQDREMDEITAHHGNTTIATFKDEQAEKLIKWLDVHSVDIDETHA